MTGVGKALHWWPIVVAVIMFAAAMGGQQVTIAGQEEKLGVQKEEIAENKKAIVSLKQGQARIDERTENIQLQQRYAQKTLDQILKELRIK